MGFLTDGMSGKDNRGLVGSEENQKLSHEEIIKMKEEGVCGQVSDSITFVLFRFCHLEDNVLLWMK